MGRTYRKFGDLMLMTICFFSLFFLAGQTSAMAAEKIVVSLPEFPVKLNGMEMDNQYSQYPLLVYNNITYFPMTYYGSRYLGVETTWSREGGLGVYQNGVRWSWHPYKRYLPNGKTGVAKIHSGVIRVNDILIDNSVEDYPLLSFRDVTYFPLTWRFAVEEFGWTYQYNPQDGLTVYSPGAVTANEITLPIKEYDDGAGAFLKVGEHYYYEGERGVIWQASVVKPSRAKKVYQLPLQRQQSGFYRQYCRPTLIMEQGMVLLTYQQQEETKTVSHYIQLTTDGTAQELYQGDGILRCFGEPVVLIEPNEITNKYSLQVRNKYNGAFQKIAAKDFYCAGDNIYYTGTELLMTGGLGKATAKTTIERKILAINDKTGAVRQLTKEDVSFFTVEDEVVYYLNDTGQLYKMPLAGGKAMLVSAIPATQFVVHSGTVCYANKQNGELKVLGSTDNLNPGGIVERMEVQEDFFVIDFAAESSSAYRTMILSRKGKVLFKTTERTASMIIENGKVSFVKLRNQMG